jgi:photosystem II stability/assembly factor-like uncharacterized protein
MQRIRTFAVAAWAAIMLSACGGGGDSAPGTPPTPTPVAVPATITVNPAAKAEAGEATKFSSSAASTAGLQHKWDFGDGSTSDEASPSHSYAKAGDYEVVLKVSNSAGESREVRSALVVRAMANVAGLVCTEENQSGWCWQRPRPSGNQVNRLVFVTPSIAWRAGDRGEIFKTTDGGLNWVQQRTGTQADLLEADFADDKRGAALGRDDVLLTTADGGATWKLGKAPAGTATTPGLRLLPDGAMYLPDANAAYLSADNGTSWTTVGKAAALSETGVSWYIDEAKRQVSRSADGGRTMAQVYDFKAEASVPGFVSLQAQVIARGDKTAVLRTVAGRTQPEWGIYVEYRNVFHRTVDGGATWTRVQSDSTDSAETEMVALSADGMLLFTQYYGGYPRVSGDGGQTWTAAKAPSGAYLDGVIVGPDRAMIARSVDETWLAEGAGSNWVRMNRPTSGYSGLVPSLGGKVLIALDMLGARQVSVDRGLTWQPLLATPLSNLTPDGFDAAFLDAKTGFVLDPAGKLLATTDGGQTWTVRRGDLAVGGGSVHAVGTQTVVVRDNDGRLLRSSDRGMNWVTDASDVRYRKVEFGKAGLGWGFDSAWRLVATQDGGVTWARVGSEPAIDVLNDVYQSDANNWVAVGYSRRLGPDARYQHFEAIAYTRDGGKSWSNAAYENAPGQSGQQLHAVSASDAKTLWAVGTGSTVLRSDDGGAQWNKVPQTGVDWWTDIGFADAQRGWAVGLGGALMATTDGGKTWAYQASGSKVTLSRLHIVDSKTLWISGTTGALLTSATGGVR